MTDRLNKTSICSILFLDIVDYSKKSVSEQFDDKALFNNLINEAIKNIAQNDRIILDTGDGAAITLMGEPEEALFVALTIRDGILLQNKTAELPLLVRIGINLGSVRVVKDINDRLNVIGDGINVAQRVMSFAGENQILVSRSYYEVTSRLTKEITGMFVYSGIKHDKHVREHEVYSIKPNLAHQTFDQYDAIMPAKNSATTAATLAASMASKLNLALENSTEKVKAMLQVASRLIATGVAVSKRSTQSIEWNALTLGLMSTTVLLFILFIWLFIKPADNAVTDPMNNEIAPGILPQADKKPVIELVKSDSKVGVYSGTKPETVKSEPAKSSVEKSRADKSSIDKSNADITTEKQAAKVVEKPILTSADKPVKKAKPKVSTFKPKEYEQVKAVERTPEPVAPPACSQAEIAMNHCSR